ncbi:MAG: AsmA family protein [Gammaproteobacteria bacterium]|nr:AsmA family protein [Gammaproteobacteria bacterium]MBI5618925.1 AsmA family protein [Gammaproteobacteria bacterium]
MKAVKVLAIVGGVLVVLFLAALAAVAVLADPNRYKSELAAKVAASTGRALTIEGPIEWGFFPKVRLEAGPVTFGNAEGFGPEPFVAAKKIAVSVATLPLLSSRIEMDTFKLYGAEVHLVRHEDGTTNWTDLSKSGTAGDKTANGGGSAAGLALGGVDVRDAAFTFRDEQSGRQFSLTKLNVTTGPYAVGAPVEFKLTGDVAAKQPTLSGPLTIAGTASYDPGDGRYTIKPFALDFAAQGPDLPGGKADVKAAFALDANADEGTLELTGLTLDGPGVKLAGEVHADHLNAAHPGGKGRLALEGTDIAVLFKALGLPAAGRLAQLGDRSFGLKTDFDANMESGIVKVPALEAKLVGATLTGNIDAERANTDEPAVHGRLHAAGADLPAVVLVASQLQGLDAKQSEALQQALAKAGDKSFDVATALDGDLAKGEMKLDQLQIRVLGNELGGQFAADGKGEKMSVKGTLDARGKDLPALLAVAAGFGGGAGLAEFAKNLAGVADKSFTLAIGFDATPKAGRISVPKLEAKALAATASGHFEANKDALDGQFTLRDEQPGAVLAALGQADMAKSVKSLALDAAVKGTRANLAISPLKLTAAVNGVGDLVLGAGNVKLSLANETANVQDLSLTGLGLNLEGALEATKISSAPEFSGTLDLPAANLRKALVDLGVKLGPMADPNALSAVALSTKFKGTARSVALDPLSVKLDGSTLNGNVAVRDFAGPDVAFKLTLDTLDADRYLPPKRGKETRAATPEAAAAGAALLPVETLRKVKLDGHFDAGALQVSGLRLANVKLGATGSGGKLAMSPIAADLYQGRYDGHAAIDATGAEAKLDIDTKLTNVALEPLLKDLADKDVLSGTANLDVRLSALGGTSARLENTLGGQIKVNVQNGIFRGVDVPAILHAAEVAIESKNVPPLPTGGQTQFQSLTGTLDLRQGTITTKDLLMNGAGFKITDSGMLANLNDMSWKHDPQISVDQASTTQGAKTYKLGGYTIPLRCRGEISGKSCLPDFGDIAKAAATQAIKKQIEKKGGDVLKKLFNGF